VDGLADTAAVAWPLALTFATVAVVDRRRSLRRRERLNRSLHELRRPLQALALAPGAARGQVERAISALAGLDREINGGPAPGRDVVEADRLLRAAVERWREPAAALGHPLELAAETGDALLLCEPEAIARALDNLIANAVEHGGGTVVLCGRALAGRVRLIVRDEGGRLGAASPAGDPRRGHGHDEVGRIAQAHGGRFLFRCDAGATHAVLELPRAG
jgi:signal transduction histidine kinase